MSTSPTLAQLEPRLRAAALHIAQVLRARGREAWLVGGAVRDMLLGSSPKDIDFASDASPDEIEAAFEHTAAVGKSFGTVIVVHDGVEAQVTSFRSESGHYDARRPSAVSFAGSLEVDAARRDFTCNALYLDPLNDELRAPVGGRADLEARVLRTVGDPIQRFAEDGLRLVRMARLAAAHGLEVAPETFEAARASLSALRGVSAERRLHELELIFARRRCARALELLERSGVLEALLPGYAALGVSGEAPRPVAERWRALSLAPDPPGAVLGLALLFDPARGRDGGDDDARERAAQLLLALKPSRAVVARVRDVWRLQSQAHQAKRPSAARHARIRLVREPDWPLALAALRAWRAADGDVDRELEGLAQWAAGLSSSELHPKALLSSADLAACGIPRGPRWRELLDQAERRQLDGRFGSRDEALEWLSAQAT